MSELRVKNSYKIRGEVHSSATAGVRRSQDEVSDNWQCQVMSSYKIRREVPSSSTAGARQ